MDPERIKEVQDGRVEFFKRKEDLQFTKNGRGAEITIDLVLQARATMSENRVNGPEDAVVSETIKQLFQEKFLHHRSTSRTVSGRWRHQVHGRS